MTDEEIIEWVGLARAANATGTAFERMAHAMEMMGSILVREKLIAIIRGNPLR